MALRIDRRWSSAATRVTKYGFDLSDPSGVKYPGVETERAAYDAGREGDTVEGLIWRGEVVSISWPGATHMTARHPARVPPMMWILPYALFASLFILILLRARFSRHPARRA